jgi:ABC-type transport system involved in cytochrome c biogenesis permease subunit
MASSGLIPLTGALCFLLSAVIYARGWRAGPWLGAAGIALLAGTLAARGLRSGFWPLTGEYEFALAFAMGTALAAIAVPLVQHGGSPPVQALAMLLATALVIYARIGVPDFKQAIQPLPPTLDSMWLPLHVGTAALAYGSLATGGSAGLALLVGGRVGDNRDRRSVEAVLSRAVATGYPLLTLSMIFGMIWAQVAWGRYWGWDLKEVWTLVTWLVYTLFFHLRTRPKWRGRRLALLALGGLGAVLFTFLGVGWLARVVGLESLHLF